MMGDDASMMGRDKWFVPLPIIVLRILQGRPVENIRMTYKLPGTGNR